MVSGQNRDGQRDPQALVDGLGYAKAAAEGGQKEGSGSGEKGRAFPSRQRLIGRPGPWKAYRLATTSLKVKCWDGMASIGAPNY